MASDPNSPGALTTDLASLSLDDSLESIISTIKRPPNTNAPRLIDTVGKEFPYVERIGLIEELWEIYDKQRSQTSHDRNNFPVPACIGSPGIGKTRFLIESLASPHCSVQNNFVNYCHVLVTYNNGNDPTTTEISMGAEKSIAVRLLYRYFIETSGTQKTNLKKLFALLNNHNVTLVEVLALIRLDIIKQRNLDQNAIVHLAIGVDEFNKVIDLDTEESRIGFLKSLVTLLGSTAVSPPSNMKLFVIFSGTARAKFKMAMLESSFPMVPLAFKLLQKSAMLQIVQQATGWENVEANIYLNSLLVDIGGHPRHLESLVKILLENATPTDQIEWIHVANQLRSKILGDLTLEHQVYEEIVRDIIQQQSVIAADQVCPPLYYTYSDLERLGVIILEPTLDGKFNVRWPHLFLRAFSSTSNNSTTFTLKKLLSAVCCYDDRSDFWWQDFEIFCARFLALKIASFAGEDSQQISLMGQLLRGAIYNDQRMEHANITIPSLKACSNTEKRATARFPKNKSLHTPTKNTPISWDKTATVVINNEGAAFDFFCHFDSPSFKSGLIVCGQTKYFKESTLPLATVMEEYEKVEEEMDHEFSNWILVIFTTGRFVGDVDDIPEKCAIIASNEFSDFFTPSFAERIYFSCTKKLNVNTAPAWALERIEGLGEITCRKIIKQRNTKAFLGEADLRDRVPRLSQKVLQFLTYE